MKQSFFTLAAGGLLACVAPWTLHGQGNTETKDYPTAYTALRLVGKTLGADAINRVVEVSGRDGKPQPLAWKIVLKEGEGTREVEVVNGKIESQRPLTRGTTSVPVKLQELNLDSSGAFDATDAQARKTRVRFDSINYTLRTSEKSGKPTWTLELLNQEGVAAGTMRIAANTGTVTSMEGRIATENTTKPVVTDNPPVRTVKSEVRPSATPKTVTSTTIIERAVPPRETLRNPPTTTTVTTVQTNPAPVAVIDVPDANPGQTITVTAEDSGGGFFTRTGRTLDRTSHTVTRSLDRAGHDVDHHLRRAGATVQRFFTGRSDLDGDSRPGPQTAPPPDEPMD